VTESARYVYVLSNADVGALYNQDMGFFERGPKPVANIRAEQQVRGALDENATLMREYQYKLSRTEQLLPLLREEAGLEIDLELETARLQVARGNHRPTALASQQAAADKLASVRAEIKEKDGKLREQFGLPPSS
jgi:hypothetical protein